MTNTVTLKIGSASTGRDYATFAAAWAAIPNDLVAADVSYILEPYNDSEFTLTSTFNMTGKTTDAGHTILVRPAAGHSFEDNANVLTNALRYNLANGVGINAGLYQIINQNAYTTIEGLQVRGGISNNVSPSGFVVNSYDTAVIQNCLVEYSGADARSDMTINSAFGSSVHRGIFRNIVIVLTTANSNGVRMYNDTAAVIEHITVNRLPSLARGFYGLYAPFGSYSLSKLIRNCYVAGANFSNTNSGTFVNCASDGALTIGTGALQNIAAASVFVDPTTDLRLKAGAPLIDAGVTPSSSNVYTISGNRQMGTSADIGAWEYPQAISAPTARITAITVTGTSVTISGTYTGSITGGQANIAPITLAGNNAVAQGPNAITIGSGTFSATFNSCRIGKYSGVLTVSNSAYSVTAQNDIGGFEIVGPKALSIVQDPVAGQTLTVHGTCSSALSGALLVPAAATNPNGATQQLIDLAINTNVTPNTYTASATLAPGNYDPSALTFTNADGTSLPQGGTTAVTIYAISGNPDAPAQEAPDTVPPVMSGTMTITNVTATGMTATWTAGTDDIGVVAYEFSLDDGTTWANIGNVLTTTLTSLTPSTLYQLRVRALDPGNNRSNELTAQNTTLAQSGGGTPTPGARTVTLSMVNSTGAFASGLSNLKWAWFDQATPNLFTAPTDKGALEFTDAAGAITIPLPNSQLAAGAVGWLIVTDSVGDPTLVHNAFSGPVTVA